MKIEIPRGALAIMEKLRAHGYRADIVGGCVRDSLLGREPYDFDITTNASPDEMIASLGDFRVIKTGIAHGTLTVISDNVPYEVTTYRIDGKYTDARHPESVSFTSSLEEDLARRDFTVNAMAYSEEYGLTDLYGGKKDLSARVIRTVGVPEERFSEDALRILRALRFASVLSFTIEESTARAIHSLKNTLPKVSAERIYTEWKKLLGGDGAYEIISEFSDVIAVFLPELSEISVEYPDRFLSLSSEEKMIMLFAASESCAPLDAFLSAAQRLKTERRTQKNGLSVLGKISAPTGSRYEILLLLSELGRECTQMLFRVRFALGSVGACEIKMLEDILKDGSVYSISELKIGGAELMSEGIFGADIGRALDALLHAVMRGTLQNEKEELLSYLKQMKERLKDGI